MTSFTQGPQPVVKADTLTVCSIRVPVEAQQQSLVVAGFARKVISATPVRTAELQETSIDIWYEAYPHSPKRTTLTLCILQAGQPIPPIVIAHVDTVITPAGVVWHVYATAQEVSEQR